MPKRKRATFDPADLLRHVPREPAWHSTGVIARASRVSHKECYQALEQLRDQGRVSKRRVGLKATWTKPGL